MIAHLEAGDALAQGVHDARAINAQNQRQHGMAMGLCARAHGHVQHTVHRGGVDADADLAKARLRIGDGLVAQDIRRAELMENHGLHERGSPL